MTKSFRPLIALPTYNNERSLRDVAERCLTTGPAVLVVDDGSAKPAAQSLENLPVNYLRHKANQGKGVAIRTALRWAEEHDFSHMVTIDTDGQHDPKDIPDLLEATRRHPMSIILGCRDFENTDVPRGSRFGRWWSNLWVYLTSGERVGDSQSGFRVYPVGPMRQLKMRAHRYSFEVEALVRGAWAGLNIVDVPVGVQYQANGERVSHFRPFMDNLRTTGTYTHLFFRHFAPWPHNVMFGPDARQMILSWRHPWQSIKSVHHRVFSKQDKAEMKQLSLRHPIRSLRHLHVDRTSPKEIGMSAAMGVFIGSWPTVTGHTLLIFFATTRLKLNRAVAFYASNLCAPFWPPFVPALNILLGHYLLRGEWLTFEDVNTGAKLWQTLGKEIHLRYFDYALGSVLIAPMMALIVGPAAWWLAKMRQKTKRRHRCKDKSEKPPRSSPRYGGWFGYAFFRALIRMFGVQTAYVFLWPVVSFYVLCRPSVRRSDEPYLCRRYPGTGRLRRLWLTIRHIVELGKVLIDQGALGILGLERYQVSFPNESSLYELAAEGRGVILLCSHMGPWQAAMATMRALGVPLSFQFQTEEHTRGRAFWELAGREDEFHIIPPDSPMGGMIEMTAALGRGEAVAIMGDRAFGAPTVEAKFIGETAPVSRAPYHLSWHTGAPLAALFARRTGPMSLELCWQRIGSEDSPANPDGNRAERNTWIEARAAEYTQCLEARVDAYPLQWFNFFDFWQPADHD